MNTNLITILAAFGSISSGKEFSIQICLKILAVALILPPFTFPRALPRWGAAFSSVAPRYAPFPWLLRLFPTVGRAIGTVAERLCSTVARDRKLRGIE